MCNTFLLPFVALKTGIDLGSLSEVIHLWYGLKLLRRLVLELSHSQTWVFKESLFANLIKS